MCHRKHHAKSLLAPIQHNLTLVGHYTELGKGLVGEEGDILGWGRNWGGRIVIALPDPELCIRPEGPTQAAILKTASWE